MASKVSLSLNQFLKLKNGYIRTNRENYTVRIEVNFGNRRVSLKTGLDLQGFRYLEEAFKSYIPEGFELESTSSSLLGVTLEVLNSMAGETYGDKANSMRELMEKQRASYDKFGFIVERNQVRGSPADYLEGREIDVLVCANERAVARTKKLLADEEGVWQGLEFHFKKDGDDDIVSEVGKVLEIFEDWNGCEFVKPKHQDEKETAITAYEPRFDWATESEEKSLEEKFLALTKIPLSTKSEKERTQIFWAGGRPPMSRRKAGSVASKCFPVTDYPIPIGDFINRVVDNLEQVWDYESVKSEVGASSVEDLAVGQMIRSIGQLRVQAGARKIQYDPTPAAYISGQKRGERCGD